ncbi:thiol-disulfide oxidoreductase DCC family protein [Paenibacillus turpanensis]|uniref:thiol-disulfide oxidoreductase DCC family protein n=1 Tax=Paenibacillus turpanensis TaxID=2689078 RepID=UPI00140A956C|nr:thiol-disulfide oxidoreductase DCC family protein [Paenibacillus turpanensis]
MKQNSIVLFDGVCNLCNGAVQFILKRDRNERFRFAAQQSEAGQKLMKAHGVDQEASEGHGDTAGSFVLIEGGRAYLRSAAALRIAKGLGFPWSLCYAGIVIPRPVRDAMYRYVAKNRYRWFGKQESCMMPTPQLKSRFVGDHEV